MTPVTSALIRPQRGCPADSTRRSGHDRDLARVTRAVHGSPPADLVRSMLFRLG
jgi:hypothetical protein